MTIEMSLLVPHVPSITHEDQIPDFQLAMATAMKKLGEELRELKPDAIVLISCHWPSTFFHYIDATPNHKGTLTALEAPDLIKDVPYEFKGDHELGINLYEAGLEAGIQVKAVNDPFFVWDYGSVVPLRYLNRAGEIPTVNLSVTLAASLEETYKWGEVITKVLEDSDKKYVFVSSGALSHNLVRGRHNKPTASEHALDKQFIQFIMNKDYESAYKMLPEYARMAKVESGGRHLAMLLATLKKKKHWLPTYIADGQSSGSWNAVITFCEKDYSYLIDEVQAEVAT